jgi:hypothetical protein
MTRSLTRTLLTIAAVAVVAMLAGVSRVAAAVIEFPAGVACSYPLRLDIATPANRVQRTFTDKNGNPIKVLSVGKGNVLTFSNLSTGTSLILNTKGSAGKTTFNPDGSSTFLGSGYNVVIFFPTDVPTGPSTILYVGNLIVTTDQFGTSTLQKTSGTSTDICAALTP